MNVTHSLLGSVSAGGSTSQTVSDTFTMTDAASAVVNLGAISQWFNSSEADSSSSNSDNLMSWDGVHGFGFTGDVEGYRSHIGVPPTSTDIQVFTGAYNSAPNLQYTQGIAGSIFYQYRIPSNQSEWEFLSQEGILVCKADGTGALGAWGSGAPYAFCHGELAGANSNYMGDYDFVRGVSEFYLRFRRYFPSDYTFGAEKTMTINPPNWGGGAGIIWLGMGFNIGGSQSTTGNLGITTNGTDTLYNSLLTLNRNHVYEIQLYARRTGANGTHILKVWADDLGTPGSITLPSGGNMTNRLNVTNATIIPTTGSHTQFGNCWPESWSNAVSLCAAPGGQYTNMLAREFNGGTAGNSPILCRAA